MIISLYAGILSLIYLKITADTIRARYTNQISLGAGENNEIIKFTRAHSNFIEYAVLFIVLAYLLEKAALLPTWAIHLFCLLFTLGRIFHYLGMTASKMDFKKRRVGMILTIASIFFLSLLNIFSYIKA